MAENAGRTGCPTKRRGTTLGSTRDHPRGRYHGNRSLSPSLLLPFTERQIPTKVRGTAVGHVVAGVICASRFGNSGRTGAGPRFSGLLSLAGSRDQREPSLRLHGEVSKRRLPEMGCRVSSINLVRYSDIIHAIAGPDGPIAYEQDRVIYFPRVHDLVVVGMASRPFRYIRRTGAAVSTVMMFAHVLARMSGPRLPLRH